MLEPPYEIISCSWPRPVEQVGNMWISEPDWDAAQMSMLPQAHWSILNDELCWTIDWRDYFRMGLKVWDPYMSGEMRGFHVVFQLRIKENGMLVIWDDDGSIIRCDGKIVHDDRSAHPLSRSEIGVRVGDVLNVAQWQLGWDWLWGARMSSVDRTIPCTVEDALTPLLRQIQKRLSKPNGPPLKMYTNGHTPVRVVASLYSLILKGYSPSAVYLFGENQWSLQTHNLFSILLPFAKIVTAQEVIARLRSLGSPSLVDLASRYWFVMKMSVALLYPPEEFCYIDDDVFILDSLDDALEAFQSNDLVFAPDQDLGAGYAKTWGMQAYNTRKFNAGLYCLRQVHDPRWLAKQALRGRPSPNAPFYWEQGFIAIMYARKKTLELPSQRYLFPLFDGLPGGLLGYDYTHNPCGFASIHYGGLAEKPSDGVAIHLLNQLLKDDSVPKIVDEVAVAR